MGSIEFQYTETFYLLAFIPVFVLLYFLYRGYKAGIMERAGDIAVFSTLIKTHSRKRELLKVVLFVIAFGLGCLAIANPRKPDTIASEERKGIDVVFILDVSNSMLATDVQPSRLAVAKKFLTLCVNSMPNDRIGLVLFAGHAYLQMPLSTDHDAARLFISTASPNAVPEQGTSISEALERANLALDKSDRFKTIVLVTDGETHDEEAMEKANLLARSGVMINTLGIGSVQGTTLIDESTKRPRTDDEGNIVVSKLNEEILKELAKTTNGAYIHLENEEAAKNTLLAQYVNVEKKALPDMNGMQYISFYWWIVVAMAALLVTEVFISDRKKVSS